MPDSEQFETRHPSGSVGEHLRRLRQERRLNVAEVAELTRISSKTIQAIEDSNYSQLPADTFAKGLVGKYAKFLDCDGEALSEDFFRERETMQPGRQGAGGRKSNMPLQPVRLAEPVHISSALVAGLLLLALILSFSLFCLYTSWNPVSFLMKKTETAPVPFMPLPGMLPAQESPPPNAPEGGSGSSTTPGQRPPHSEGTRALTPETATYLLEVVPLKSDLLEISIDGGLWKKQEIGNEDRLEFRAGKSLQLRFTTPESAKLTLNGGPLKFPQATDGKYILTIPEDLLH